MKTIKSIVKSVCASLALVATSVYAETAVYQIPNASFDLEWTSSYEPGNGFHSFSEATTPSGTPLGSTINKTVKSNVAKQVLKKLGHNDDASCAIVSYDISLAKANANLTTGNIVAGAMKATDKGNHNETQRNNPNGHLLFAGRPDTAYFYTKYIKGEAGNYTGRANFILHGDYDYIDTYQDDYDKSIKGKYLEAFGQVLIQPCSQWTRIAVPFEYYTPSVNSERHYMLISFTTNPTPGGSANDSLYIDDVYFIYNSSLKSLTIGDKAVSLFAGQTEYELSTEDFDPSAAVVAVSDGVGATTEQTFDATTNVLTVTVKGNDISVNPTNMHVYTFTFKAPVVKEPEIVKSANYTSNYVVTADGKRTNYPGGKISVDFYDNGKANILVSAACDGLIPETSYEGVAYSVTSGDVRIADATSADGLTIKSAVSDIDYTSLVANFEASGITATYGVPFVAKMVKQYSYSDSIYVDQDGTIASTPEYVKMTISLFENDSMIVSIPTSNGDIMIADAAYTIADGIYTLTGDVVCTTDMKSYVSPATIISGTTTYKFASLAHLTKSSTAQYVLLTKNDGVYTDTAEVKVTTRLYDDETAVIVLPSLTLDGLSYAIASDSIRITGTSNGTAVTAATNLNLGRMTMVAKAGKVVYEIGTYEDPTGKAKLIQSADYTDNLQITVNDEESDPQTQVITVEYYDNGYAKLSILDFKLAGTQLVGDIVLDSVPFTEMADSIRMSGMREITITSDDPEAIGPYLGELPVRVSYAASSLDYTKLRCVIDIDLSATSLQQIVRVAFGYHRIIKTASYSDNLIVSVNDEKGAAQTQTLVVDFYDDNVATLSIFDFMMDDLLVGDIIVDSIPYTIDGDSIRMSGDRKVRITSDDPDALGTQLGLIPVEVVSAATDLDYTKLLAQIDIDMVLMKQAVTVLFGHELPVEPIVVPVVKEAEYADLLQISVSDGEDVSSAEPQEQTISVTYYEDGNATLSILDFKMGGELVGDIIVDSIPYVAGKDSIRMSGTRNIRITSDDASAIGTSLGEIPVTVQSASSDLAYSKLQTVITIDFAAAGQLVTVSFGYPLPEPEVPQPALVKSTTYTDSLLLSVNGDVESAILENLTIDYYEDGNATLSILDFMMGEELVGDIIVDSIPYVATDSIRMSGSRSVRIKADSPNALGSQLGLIPVNVTDATTDLDYTKLFAQIDIDMKLLGQKVTVLFGHYRVAPVIPDVPEDPKDTTTTQPTDTTHTHPGIILGPSTFEPQSVTYTDSLVVSIDGESTPAQIQDITVEYKDGGLCTLSIANFMMGSGDEGIAVGDIVLPDIEYSLDADSIRIIGEKLITIDSEMGAMLGQIPVIVSAAAASYDLEKLTANIDIDMTASLGQMVNVTFGDTELHRVPQGPVFGPSTFEPQSVTYTDSLVVSIDGESTPAQIQDITVEYKDGGLCTLSIANFMMGSGEDAIAVGDIVLPDIEYTLDADSIRITGEKLITIDSEMGAMLGEIPVIVSAAAASYNMKKLTASIDIDMSASLGQIVNVTFGFTELNTEPDAVGPIQQETISGSFDFQDTIYTTIGTTVGVAKEQVVNVSFSEDGTATITIAGLSFSGDDGETLLGDLVIEGLKYRVRTDDVVITGSATVQIESDDPMAIGFVLGDIPVKVVSCVATDDQTKLKMQLLLSTEEALNGRAIAVTFGLEPTTGVETVVADEAVDGRIYTVMGVCFGDRVDRQSLPAGIYIQGGKKFIVR